MNKRFFAYTFTKTFASEFADYLHTGTILASHYTWEEMWRQWVFITPYENTESLYKGRAMQGNFIVLD